MSAKSSLLTVSQDELNWVRQNSIFKAMEDRNASMHNGMKKAREQGLQEGIAQGERNKTIEMAKNALAMGLSIEQISQLTGLTKEEIKKES